MVKKVRQLRIKEVKEREGETITLQAPLKTWVCAFAQEAPSAWKIILAIHISLYILRVFSWSVPDYFWSPSPQSAIAPQAHFVLSTDTIGLPHWFISQFTITRVSHLMSEAK